MKKTSTLKKLGIAAVAVPVCFAMAAPCFVAATTAHAEPEANAKATLVSGLDIVSECDYGDTFTVPAGAAGTTITVTAPNGVKIADGKTEAQTVTADQVGNYVVSYVNGKMSYDYRVYVSLKEEYFLKVVNNGAGIPTYIQSGDSFTLPGADVVFYDDNNILQDYPNADTNVKLTISTSKQIGDKSTFNVGDTVTPTDNGKLYVTYSAAVGGADGTKYFNKTFTVNVQSTFTDTEAPRLSVAGVTESVSINRAVTLPKATATDDHDGNILVGVTVTDPDGEPVKTVDIDRDGYAYQLKEGGNYKAVEFDNDEVMTFYPVKEGPYTVRYKAVDDKGNESSERVYTITAGDHVAPVFKDIDDYKIPETWSVTNVTNASGDVSDKKIYIPIPELVDNKSRVGNADDPISLYLRITDVEKSTTILTIDNVLADDAAFTGNSTYGESGTSYPVDKENGVFEFDLEQYHRSGDSADLNGEYTIYYRASDKSGNRSTKSYTVNVRDDFTDDAAPSRADVTAPAYVAIADKEFTIPTPEVADATDSRPQVIYRVYSEDGESKDNFIDVEGGETAEFGKEGDVDYLYINKGKTDISGSYEKKLKLGDNLYFVVVAKDKVGNAKSNAALNADATDVEDFKTCEAKTNIIKSIGVTVGLDTTDVSIVTGETGGGDIISGKKVKAGGFKITTGANMREYVGFEVIVKDGKDNVLNVTLETYSAINGNNAEIFVKNISFNAGAEGTHKMTVRAFDVNGKQTVEAFTFDVKPSSNNPGSTSSTTIGTTGSVNVKYKLHNDKISGIGVEGGKYYVVRKITGGAFSLMGSELTVSMQGSYSIKDGYIDKADLDADTWNVVPYGSPYSVSVTDTAAPVIEVQGVMPTYSEKYNKDTNNLITLPSVIAFSENGNAKVDVRVTGPKNQRIETTKVDETNEYTFKGEYDGVYTVTYTATYADASPVTATYTINVGDVTGPLFTYTTGTAAEGSTHKVGDTFEFGKLEVTGETSTSNFTITKKLMNPSREEVSGATVSGSYDSYRNKVNNDTAIKLDKVGEYRVVYTVTDASGNETVMDYKFTVVNSGSSTPTTFTALSITLTVVAVVLLAGVIVYVVRFRKVKSK